MHRKLFQSPLLRFAFVCLLGFYSLGSTAEEGGQEQIASALGNLEPPMELKTAAKIKGHDLFEVELSTGQTLYSTGNAEYFFVGTMYKVSGEKLQNVTEAKKSIVRKVSLSKIKDKEAVLFEATSDEKAVVTIFTDVDCGYCRKLHKEIPKLNEAGVTVRYMAFPRSGIYEDRDQSVLTGSFKKLQSIWCDADRKLAMNKGKATGFVKENLDCGLGIIPHLELGRNMGVKGTPAIFLESGEMIPGYMEAEGLVRKLNL